MSLIELLDIISKNKKLENDFDKLRKISTILNMDIGWKKVEKKHQKELYDEISNSIYVLSKFNSFVIKQSKNAFNILQNKIKLLDNDNECLSFILKFTVAIDNNSTGFLITNEQIITCAHCIDHFNDPNESSSKKKNDEFWKSNSRIGRYKLITYQNGVISFAICEQYNNDLDIAILKILNYKIELPTQIKIAKNIKLNTKFIQVHNPYPEDLETKRKNVKIITNFPFATNIGEIVEIRLKDKKLIKNGFGSIIHNSPCQWGSSGSPLFCEFKGDLVVLGMHNSWDSQGKQQFNSDEKVNVVARHAITGSSIIQALNDYGISFDYCDLY